jgi:hypothetical protein
LAGDRKLNPHPYTADEGLGASFASTLPGERTGPGRSDFTALPQPSPVDTSRERKRRTRPHPARSRSTSLETQAGNDVKRRKSGVGMREQRLTASGNPGREPPAPRPIKRPHIRHDVHAISSCDVNHSQRIPAQRIELVVITDTEPESSEDDKN